MSGVVVVEPSTPVVASDDPALRELLAEAGLYADANDPAGFAEHVHELLTRPGELARRSRAVTERVASCSWRAAAERVVEILDTVAEHG